MTVDLEEQCAESTPVAPAGNLPEGMFVSSTLRMWTTPHPEWFARDVQINDTAYRRLDPEYYAWLRSRMVLAKKAATSGQIDAAAFEELRVRFNAVHEWAVQHFGDEKLLTALRALRAGSYNPPVAEDEGSHGPLPRAAKSADDHSSPEVIAMVDAIVENAMALAWSRDRLYSTGKGMFDPKRGLICYLKPGDRIGEVTPQSIEIIHPPPSAAHHRFYNPDVEQPWIKKIGADSKKHENSIPAAGISR
jgi:hypothetical protein